MIRRYKKQRLFDTHGSHEQWMQYAEGLGVTVAGPYDEQDVDFGALDADTIEVIHERIQSWGWEHVEDDPATLPTIVCCDAGGKETRLEDVLKTVAARVL